jgi:hypothetical protein
VSIQTDAIRAALLQIGAAVDAIDGAVSPPAPPVTPPPAPPAPQPQPAPAGVNIIPFNLLAAGSSGGSQRQVTNVHLTKGIVAGQFNTGSGQGMGTIAWGPGGGTYSQGGRTFAIANTPGDLNAPFKQVGANGTQYYFVGQSVAGYPTLLPNTTYYANIQNNTLPAGTYEEAFIEISRP